MDQIREIIGKRVEGEMLRRGINRAQLGELLGGVSGQLIGRYISGKAMPGGDFFIKWRDVVGYNLYDPDTPEIISSADADEYETRYLDFLRGLLDLLATSIENDPGKIDVELRAQLSKILADRFGGCRKEGSASKGGSSGKASF